MTAPDNPADEPPTRIIRRAPSGPPPEPPNSPATPRPSPKGGTHIIRRADLPIAPPVESSSRTAVAACAVSIVDGWTTSVVATDLIAGW